VVGFNITIKLEHLNIVLNMYYGYGLQPAPNLEGENKNNWIWVFIFLKVGDG